MTAQKKALLLFGAPRQLRKLAEECAELAAAALRLSEGDTKERRDHFFEESADVEIVLEQMKIHYGEIDFAAWRARKLSRLEGIVGAQSGAAELGDERARAESCERAEEKGRKSARAEAVERAPAPEDAIPIAEAVEATGITLNDLKAGLDRHLVPCTIKPGKGRGLRMVLVADVLAYKKTLDDKRARAAKRKAGIA
ncbi:MAG: hypothetical protein PHS14_08220 [Elusimicrobia bacterium]|nr:hypothetical protein [Elusimicrobiota bacterium]